MAATSDGQLAFVKETVAGTTPATPAFKILDFTSEDLKQNTQQVRSAAVTANRAVRSSRRAGKDVGNGINFELYKGAEVDMILAALMGNAFAGDPLTAKAGGSTIDSFTIERKLASNMFRRFTGCRFGSAEFTLQPEQHVGVRLGVLGFSMVTATAAIAGATYAAVTDAEKLTALDVTSVTLSDGLSATYDYEQLTFQVNNQLSVRKRLGPNSVRRVAHGQVLVTGSMRVYVDDNSLADAYNAETKFNMDVPVAFGSEGYTFLFKDIAIVDYADPNTGNNDEFMAQIEFEATLEAAFSSSFAISKTS